MDQRDVINQQDLERAQQFLEVYQVYRYQDQLDYYGKRVREFTNAQRQAIWLSIALVFLTAVAGAFEGIATSWVKSALLLIAAICPILSTALAGYTALLGFTQQAKLYHDAQKSLTRIRIPVIPAAGDQNSPDDRVEKYVSSVETILQTEHGFWGQLAEGMTPPGIG